MQQRGTTAASAAACSTLCSCCTTAYSRTGRETFQARSTRFRTEHSVVQLLAFPTFDLNLSPSLSLESVVRRLSAVCPLSSSFSPHSCSLSASCYVAAIVPTAHRHRPPPAASSAPPVHSLRLAGLLPPSPGVVLRSLLSFVRLLSPSPLSLCYLSAHYFFLSPSLSLLHLFHLHSPINAHLRPSPHSLTLPCVCLSL